MKFFYINRKGSAIAFALIIATLLLISEAFLMNQNQNNIIARRKNIENLQSYFAARAGMQHVMLKTQIMPTQLYDATCFHLGKNPYFDFSLYPEDDKPSKVFKIKKIGDKYIKLATNVNPGPRFLGENKGNVKSGESEWLVAKNQSLTSVSYDKPKDSIPHFDKNSNH
ncbi:MAG: hypothetical protein IKO19_07825, partial [Candidatus Riflebacteria bacterium]|nr:hypothetical protein [Candidatus Riflebacteria bacterium]